jgi:hypothetical protein
VVAGTAVAAASGQTAPAPEVSLVRTAEPPVIDGVLDDPAWAQATVIDGFRQVEPMEDAEPTERTEVSVLFDRDFIYFGIRCHDSNPQGIVAKQLRRDGDLDSDDRIELVIDPWLSRREGFFFAVNPVGARRDALVERGGDLLEEWDGIWYAKAAVDESGWSAEIAVPFKTLSFAASETRWGFNIERTVRRNNETSRWASPRQNKELTSMADAGVLREITEIEQGIGLDVKPYVRGTYRHDDVSGDDFDPDAGLDVFYKLTPSMTLTLTFNTDFAETEVDERRVNLTRFPLFFPEKRDFFLQDAGIFDFGGIRMNPLPFQSRRIGLDDAGQPVDLIAGAKLTGRTGPLTLGFLNVFQDDSPTVEDKNLTVGRVTLDVLEESTVGLITTIGDPQTNEDNAIVGGDFNFRDSTMFDGKVVESNAWFLQSFNSGGQSDDYAAGFKLSYPNDTISWFFSYTEIGDDFNAALGFVPRRGIREYFGRWQYRWRPQSGWIRTIDSSIRGELITNLDNDLETSETSLELAEITTDDGDTLTTSVEFNREVLENPFEIQEGVVIPDGSYTFTRVRGEVGSSSGRPISFGTAVEGGDFFDGDRLDLELWAELRPSPHFFLSVGWERNDVDLPGGAFVVNIVQSRVDLLLTPDIAWTNFIQWDDVTDSFGINSRLRWIVEPGNELFLVLNQAFDTTDGRFDGTSTELTTKLGWTFRF